MRRWLKLPLVLAVLLAITAGGTASAAASQPASSQAHPAAVGGLAGEEEITGEPWTPEGVTCTIISTMAVCSPEDDSDNVELTCYWAVPSEVGSLTVCSSASQNQGVLDRRGEKLEYNWGCGLTFDGCALMEGMAEASSVIALNMGARAAEAVRFNTGSMMWDAAVEQWSFWVWAVWVVLLGAGIVAITRAAFSGSGSDIIQAVLRFAVTVPLTQATLWITGNLVNAVDELTMSLFEESDPWGTVGEMLFSDGVVAAAYGLVVSALFLVTMLLLFIVLMARNIALAALVMVGPIAWMLFPLQSIGKEWLMRYVASFASLLLAGPIMMSLFGFIASGLRRLPSIWDPGVWPYLLAMLLMLFAPFVVFSLFSFVGGSVIDGAAGAAGRGALAAPGQIKRAIPQARQGQAAGSAPRPTAGSRGGAGGASSTSRGGGAVPTSGGRSTPAPAGARPQTGAAGATAVAPARDGTGRPPGAPERARPRTTTASNDGKN